MRAYGHKWRTVIRPRILSRDHHKCEQCGKPDRKVVEVIWRNGEQYWRPLGGSDFNKCSGRGLITSAAAPKAERERQIVRLDVAHLDGNTSNSEDLNLRALCRFCHTRVDRDRALAAAKATRSAKKDASRELLQSIEIERALELQREWQRDYLENANPLTMLGIADSVMEEVLIRMEGQ